MTLNYFIFVEMASGPRFIGLLCLTSGLLIGTNARFSQNPAGSCETCPPGWTWFGGRCFIFEASEKTWADAERFCSSLDGNLASFRSTTEYAFIRQLIYRAANSHKTAWVGGHDAVENNFWMWSDGTKFVFNAWGNGEPNNSGGAESCMEINFNEQDYVNDKACTFKRSFVCAKDP